MHFRDSDEEEDEKVVNFIKYGTTEPDGTAHFAFGSCHNSPDLHFIAYKANKHKELLRV